MLIAEGGGTFRMTIESGPGPIRVSWIVVQGTGESALTETEALVAPNVDEARHWAHRAARLRGFKKIRVRKAVAPGS